MTNFNDLRYVNSSGLSAPVDPSHVDNPYFGQTKLSKDVLVGDMKTLRWIDRSGMRKSIHFKTPTIAAVDPKSDLLVVIVHFGDTQYRRPSNGVVFTQEGVIDHVITPPEGVDQIIEQLPGKDALHKIFPVEAIAEVLLSNERILIGLNFNYEWIERRYYDPSARTWQERDQIYRK